MLSLRRPENPLLRTLWDPLVEDVLREVELAVKVAALGHHGLKSTEIADRLGIQPADVLEARRWLKRARASRARRQPGLKALDPNEVVSGDVELREDGKIDR
jgi:hypothetical protein